MLFRSMFSLFFLCIHCCFALPLPEGAPLSLNEWALCEKFIAQKAEKFFEQGIFSMPAGPDLPCPIEKDQKTGHLYINLKGKEGAHIGRGSHKVVSKSILYGKKPCLVARCEIDQAGAWEAKVLEDMRHQHGVIHCFSYIPLTDHSCELFLEYFNCGSYTTSGRKFSLQDVEILSIMNDLITGLKGMHERGYIHRDIKRENVFLHRTAGKVRAALGDLGLALEINKDPERHVAVPDQNCPPEVLLKPYPNIDRRKSEVYSLGVIFYLMLFQTPPKWSHIIHQADLKTSAQEQNTRRYRRFESLYFEQLEKRLLPLTGLKRELTKLTFTMLHPTPEKRISLNDALKEVTSLLKKWSNGR